MGAHGRQEAAVPEGAPLRRWSPGRRTLLAVVTVLISLMASLAVAEVVLRAWRQHIESSDRMDPGMILYDRALGWRLKPRWRGRHAHFDFSVEYAINELGFRGAFPTKKTGQTYAVLGDSFTFGLGVDDDATFVHDLNQLPEGRGNTFLNFGVPGYSTDQEYLLFKRRVRHFKPDRVLLMVYLANDLFDNTLAFPLQAANAKPYFRLEAGRLELENSPVPLQRKSGADLQRSLASLVLPEGAGGGTQLELLRLTGLFRQRVELSDTYFEGRFGTALDLFSALVRALDESVRGAGAELKLVLLAGRSFSAEPEGFSAQYQDFLRRRILAAQGKLGVAVIDMAEPLRRADGAGLYYPHEGHLTPEGNRVLARLLGDALAVD